MSLPRLLAVTPPTGPIDPGRVELWMSSGAEGLPLALWLREPGGSPARLLGPRMKPLVERARGLGIPVLLGIDGGALEEAAGVLANEDVQGVVLRGDPRREQLERVRARIGDGPWLGRSSHDPGVGDHDACDFTVLAPIYQPRTAKGFPTPTLGREALTRASASTGAHIIALGGLDARRAKGCVVAGALGLAGIRSFFGHPERVAQDVAAFCRALQRATHAEASGRTGGPDSSE